MKKPKEEQKESKSKRHRKSIVQDEQWQQEGKFVGCENSQPDKIRRF